MRSLHIRAPFCSGSNYATQTFLGNGLRIQNMEVCGTYGCWKHTLPELLMGVVEPLAYQLTTLVLLIVRHPLAWMASMSTNMQYGISCQESRLLNSCRVMKQDAREITQGLYNYRRCAQPELPTSPLRPLEGIWEQYYSGYRAWASQTMDLGQQALKQQGAPAMWPLRGPVMLIRYEDLLFPAPRDTVVQHVVLAATGVRLNTAVPVKVVTWPAKSHGHPRNLSSAAGAFERCEYLNILHPDAVARVLNSSSVTDLSHSFEYSLPCPLPRG